VTDIFFLAVAAGFTAATWGLVVLCDRLMAGGR
jgi:hypothetical protein